VGVLGLVTIAIQLVLSLRYDDRVLRGSVRVTVDIEMLFFSVSTSFEVQKQLAGPDDSARAAHASLDSGQFIAYLDAFAAA
jgi:hypothetical protein